VQGRRIPDNGKTLFNILNVNHAVPLNTSNTPFRKKLHTKLKFKQKTMIVLPISGFNSEQDIKRYAVQHRFALKRISTNRITFRKSPTEFP
jgi:hypothetical protein